MPYYPAFIKKSRLAPGAERIRTSILVNADELIQGPNPNVNTFFDIMHYGKSLAKGGPCLGCRPGGQQPYSWINYDQVFDYASALASGLVHLGLEPNNESMIGIYGINSPDWMLSHFACVANSMVSVPLYHTFDSPSLEHILKQTGLRIVFCDTEQRMLSLIDLCQNSKTPSKSRQGEEGEQNEEIQEIQVKYFVLMKRDSKLTNDTMEMFKNENAFRILTLDELIKIGCDNPTPFRQPKPDDVYMICYTSGTTGCPKGVILTHRNLVAAMAGMTKYFDMSIKINSKDCMLSFLPLAHVYEQAMEAYMFYYGGSVGYYQGDILKLVDDAQALRPTVFPIVPRLLNRLVDRIQKTVSESGQIRQKIFEFAVKRKQAAVDRGDWGGDSIWDKVVLKKVQAILGGRVRFLCTGSAPISPSVMKFARAVFGAVILEGYGQTESTGPATFTLAGDATVGHVGSPAPSCQIKLVDVPDLDYFADKDQGEVCIRGPIVMRGYFKEPEKTAETLDSDGWLHTGDIGRWTSDGCLQIIDRRKHFFKLSQGEYVAPEKIENVYSKCPLISQLFVDGNSLQSYLVAVAVPDEAELRKLIKTQSAFLNNGRSLGEDLSFDSLCANRALKSCVLTEMQEIGKRANLSGIEQIKAIHLCSELFSAENGLLTPTMKNRRPQLKKRFNDVIEKLYRDTNANMGT